jgi:aconitate hydratase
LLRPLIDAGARLHQAGCNGCIGMGQAPASHKNSLRTTPRNFPGRSGTPDDLVWLCSPETAAASALFGVITDPRELGTYPRVPDEPRVGATEVEPPPPSAVSRKVTLVKGPNIASIPSLDALPPRLELEVALVVGDDISTDEILPAGSRVLPYRSNVPRLSDFCFVDIDETYPERARASRSKGGHAIVAGDNYGQGSSREHAALAPRYLGLRAVLARSFARIHRSNLINYGVLPLVLEPNGIDLTQGDVLVANDLGTLDLGRLRFEVRGKGTIETKCDLTSEDLAVVRAGGRIPYVKKRTTAHATDHA